jgi:hypothetical protein
MKNEGTFLLHEATFVLVKSTMKCVLCGFSMFSSLSTIEKPGGAEAKDQKFHLLEVTWRKQFSTSKQISFHHNGKSVNQSKSPFCGF